MDRLLRVTLNQWPNLVGDYVGHNNIQIQISNYQLIKWSIGSSLYKLECVCHKVSLQHFHFLGDHVIQIIISIFHAFKIAVRETHNHSFRKSFHFSQKFKTHNWIIKHLMVVRKCTFHIKIIVLGFYVSLLALIVKVLYKTFLKSFNPFVCKISHRQLGL